MTKSKVEIWVHVIWAPKNREPILDVELRGELYSLFHRIAKEKGYDIEIVNGLQDHLHLLLRMSSWHTVQNIVKDLKGISAKWINDNQLVQGGFKWQRGYGAFSVSPWMVQKVKRYIENQ